MNYVSKQITTLPFHYSRARHFQHKQKQKQVMYPKVPDSCMVINVRRWRELRGGWHARLRGFGNLCFWQNDGDKG